MNNPDSPTGDRGPDAERRLIAAMTHAHHQGAEDLDVVLALYCRYRAGSRDPVLAFGLVEATLTVDKLSPERALRALAAAVERLSEGSDR